MNPYVKLAKNAIEEYLKKGTVLHPPQDLPSVFFAKRAGVFVTIYKFDQLRGCIGTIASTKENIAEEIIANAISACSQDPRFPKLMKSELTDAKYEVSILSKALPIKDLSAHDPKQHGIIVRSKSGKSGLLLPDLEGIDTTEEQIRVAVKKAGVDSKNDDVELFSFTVEKYS